MVLSTKNPCHCSNYPYQPSRPTFLIPLPQHLSQPLSPKLTWQPPSKSSGPGHHYLEASIFWLIWHHRQLVHDLHHQDWSFCHPCPTQHARQKVLREYQEQIECMLNDMVKKGMIAHVSQLTEWVSSLMYPHQPDGTLHICLNPKDPNKAIV